MDLDKTLGHVLRTEGWYMNMRPDEDERLNSVTRNGSYRNLDDFGRPGDRPRDNLQFGVPRRPNSSNGRREV